MKFLREEWKFLLLVIVFPFILWGFGAFINSDPTLQANFNTYMSVISFPTPAPAPALDIRQFRDEATGTTCYGHVDMFGHIEGGISCIRDDPPR